jgi:hypothetical protein
MENATTARPSKHPTRPESMPYRIRDVSHNCKMPKGNEQTKELTNKKKQAKTESPDVALLFYCSKKSMEIQMTTKP